MCVCRLQHRAGTPWIGCFIAATTLLPLIEAVAEAQFYRSAGGVGRIFDPGRLQGVSSLRQIGGFQHVASNPVLVQSLYPRPAPFGPIPIGGGVEVPTKPALKNPFTAGGLIDDGLKSLRSGPLGMERASLRSLGLPANAGESFEASQARFTGTPSIIGKTFNNRGVGQWTQPGSVAGLPGTYPMVKPGGLGRAARAAARAGNVVAPAPGGVRDEGGSEPGAHQAANESDTRQVPTKTLESLVRDRLNSEFDRYIARGRQQFRSGGYADAFNSFTLADTLRTDSLEAKEGIVLAAIATSRYAVAANAAMAIARRHPDLGARPFDIRAAYGSVADYTSHYQRFDDYIRRDTTQSAAVLAAMTAWGRGDRVLAETYASRAVEGQPADSPLVQFASSIRRARMAGANAAGESAVPGP